MNRAFVGEVMRYYTYIYYIVIIRALDVCGRGLDTGYTLAKRGSVIRWRACVSVCAAAFAFAAAVAAAAKAQARSRIRTSRVAFV